LAKTYLRKIIFKRNYCLLFVKKLSFFIFFFIEESTERELYGDLRAITGHQKSKFLLYFESSCIVITRSRKLARVITSKSVSKSKSRIVCLCKLYASTSTLYTSISRSENFVPINFGNHVYTSKYLLKLQQYMLNRFL
jgi:hypothetical protein